MKGLALCSLLFVALAGLLGYVATNGLGARSPSFASGNMVSFSSPLATSRGRAETIVPSEDSVEPAKPVTPPIASISSVIDPPPAPNLPAIHRGNRGRFVWRAEPPRRVHRTVIVHDPMKPEPAQDHVQTIQKAPVIKRAPEKKKVEAAAQTPTPPQAKPQEVVTPQPHQQRDVTDAGP